MFVRGLDANEKPKTLVYKVSCLQELKLQVT